VPKLTDVQHVESSPPDDDRVVDRIFTMAQRYPEHIIFFGSGNESTADQLTDDALRLADGMLVQGLKPGQRVFVLLGNRMEAAVILAACLAVRAIFVPLNPTYTVAEMDVYLRKLRPSLYFREAKYGPSDAAIPASELGIERHFFASDDTPRIKLPSWRTLLHDAGGPLPLVDPQAPAVLVHTSGTTGTPKFVAHTQTSLAQYVVQIVGYGFGDSARMVITLSCFYISGLTALINSIANGMSEELLDGCEPEAVLDATEKYRCTAFLLTPHMTSSLNKAQLMRPRRVESSRSNFARCPAPPVILRSCRNSPNCSAGRCTLYGA
jgi:acyl-CoA synthetase (AMP-forming)/AMP-acid ligase II